MDVQYKEKKLFGKLKILCFCCKKKEAKYVCPKCKVPYCSIKCYKDHNSDCSEEFYKDQVLAFLSSKKPSKVEKKTISEILKKTVHENDPVLEEVLENINEKRIQEIESFMNQENCLELLTINEKQELSKFLSSGGVFQFIIP